MAKQTFTVGQVLTAAQLTSLQQTAMLGGAASAKTASYTLVAADAGSAISMTSTSATTITVNTGLFAAGDTVFIQNLGTGVCTITAGTATVNTSASLALAQYEGGQLYFISASTAIFVKGAGATPSGGGMTLLSTTSLTGATTTISSISSSYVDLYLIISGVSNATADGDKIRVAVNGNTNTVYGQSGVMTLPSTLATGGLNGDYIRTTGVNFARAATTNIFILQLYNYASATTYKQWKFDWGIQSTSTYYSGNASGFINSTTAISSLVFSASGGNLSTGTVLLYGVK